MKKPSKSYIRREQAPTPVVVRIDPALKRESQRAAKKLNTSLTRFVEAAMSWYLFQLKRERDI